MKISSLLRKVRFNVFVCEIDVYFYHYIYMTSYNVDPITSIRIYICIYYLSVHKYIYYLLVLLARESSYWNLPQRSFKIFLEFRFNVELQEETDMIRISQECSHGCGFNNKSKFIILLHMLCPKKVYADSPPPQKWPSLHERYPQC